MTNGVAEISCKDIHQKRIGTVSLSWNDDEGQLHANKLNNAIYFSYSPINILSTTELYESIKDDEGTWIQTNSGYSFSTWGFGKYTRIIAHSKICSLELEIPSLFSKFAIFSIDWYQQEEIW